MPLQQYDIAAMTYDEGQMAVAAVRRDMQQKQAALRAQRIPLEKQAEFWEQLKQRWNELAQNAPEWMTQATPGGERQFAPHVLYPALGALGGLGLGGLSSLMQPKSRRRPFARALSGGLLGGLGGLGLAATLPHLRQKPSTAPGALKSEKAIETADPRSWREKLHDLASEAVGLSPEPKVPPAPPALGPKAPTPEGDSDVPPGPSHTEKYLKPLGIMPENPVPGTLAAAGAGGAIGALRSSSAHRAAQLQQAAAAAAAAAAQKGQNLPAAINPVLSLGRRAPIEEIIAPIIPQGATASPQILAAATNRIAATKYPTLNRMFPALARRLAARALRQHISKPGYAGSMSNFAAAASQQPGRSLTRRVASPLGSAALLATLYGLADYSFNPAVWNRRVLAEAQSVKQMLDPLMSVEGADPRTVKIPKTFFEFDPKFAGDASEQMRRRLSFALDRYPGLRHNPQFSKWLGTSGQRPNLQPSAPVRSLWNPRAYFDPQAWGTEVPKTVRQMTALPRRAWDRSYRLGRSGPAAARQSARLGRYLRGRP